MISVLILTLNEEANIAACLDAVKWSDDVVVFDSNSTDRTVEIATAFGARVFSRKFDNERDHRKASIQLGFKHPWVFNPDADEICTPALRDEMLDVISQPGRPEVAYRCRFKNMFMGKWIRHSSMYPTWVVRLLRPDKLRFEREINLRYVPDGPEGRLRAHFEHYSFNNGFQAWFEKHNRYSSAEARESIKSLSSGKMPWLALFSGNSARRRHALKELSFRMPMRAFARFIYLYIFRMGFLDGRAGWRYCILLYFYEYMIVVKMDEIRRRQKGLTI